MPLIGEIEFQLVVKPGIYQHVLPALYLVRRFRLDRIPADDIGHRRACSRARFFGVGIQPGILHVLEHPVEQPAGEIPHSLVAADHFRGYRQLP